MQNGFWKPTIIPEVPIVVRARYVSAEAEKKIKEAGGVVQLVA
jgi:ribosomal protein L15